MTHAHTRRLLHLRVRVGEEPLFYLPAPPVSIDGKNRGLLRRLVARDPPASSESVLVRCPVERPSGERLFEELLPEPAELVRAVLAVPADQILQRAGTGSPPGQISTHVRLELREQHLELRIIELASGPEIDRIDHDRAQAPQLFQGVVEDGHHRLSNRGKASD
ncbi:MAG: hypothetical protein ACMG6S_19740, partial [Byssovorax sp.]